MSDKGKKNPRLPRRSPPAAAGQENQTDRILDQSPQGSKEEGRTQPMKEQTSPPKKRKDPTAGTY